MYRVARITVGEGTILYPHHRFSMKRDPNIVIGSECYINQYCWFDAGDATITLGDHVVVAANVSLQAATHVPGSATRRALGPYSHSIAIGDGCWIGVGAIILPGVTVAPGCVIGAGAVVTKSTEPNGVYAGVPALRIKDLPE
jgi:acetyltransferase-like isoleucine patch superfamily enzyme